MLISSFLENMEIRTVLEMMKILHHDGDGSCDHSALLKYYQKLTGETLHH